MDMLRFQHFSINWTLAAEYGSSDKPEQFRYLRAYSPLHNLRPGTKYPPTLITAGDHDDRLPPIHSFKFAATIQHDQAGDAPVLIRIDTRSGHGGGRPVTKDIEIAADSLAFIGSAASRTLPRRSAARQSGILQPVNSRRGSRSPARRRSISRSRRRAMLSSHGRRFR
jgi:hypothetical protein